MILLAALLASGCAKKSESQLPEATLDELNQGLQTWFMLKAALPGNVSDLTNLPALNHRRLPTPPEGKKLAVDRSRRQVVFVDE